MIQQATLEDKAWVEALFKTEQKWLGGFGPTWWRYWNATGPGEKWIVIRPFAFAHYNLRRDGWRTLYELAVTQLERGHGHGRALVDYIGRPIQLKTDADNPESNPFYVALGFERSRETTSKNGKRKLVVYVKS